MGDFDRCEGRRSLLLERVKENRAARRPPGSGLVLAGGACLRALGFVLGPWLADLDGGAREIRGEVVEPEVEAPVAVLVRGAASEMANHGGCDGYAQGT